MAEKKQASAITSPAFKSGKGFHCKICKGQGKGSPKFKSPSEVWRHQMKTHRRHPSVLHSMRHQSRPGKPRRTRLAAKSSRRAKPAKRGASNGLERFETPRVPRYRRIHPFHFSHCPVCHADLKALEKRVDQVMAEESEVTTQ